MTTRSVSVSLGPLAVEALADGVGRYADDPATAVVLAVRCYLGDKDKDRPGWAYPDFLSGESGGAQAEVRLSVDDSLWLALEREAERQAVPTERALEHAVLYLAAEHDAGRTPRAILDGRA